MLIALALVFGLAWSPLVLGARGTAPLYQGESAHDDALIYLEKVPEMWKQVKDFNEWGYESLRHSTKRSLHDDIRACDLNSISPGRLLPAVVSSSGDFGLCREGIDKRRRRWVTILGRHSFAISSQFCTDQTADEASDRLDGRDFGSFKSFGNFFTRNAKKNAAPKDSKWWALGFYHNISEGTVSIISMGPCPFYVMILEESDNAQLILPRYLLHRNEQRRVVWLRTTLDGRRPREYYLAVVEGSFVKSMSNFSATLPDTFRDLLGLMNFVQDTSLVERIDLPRVAIFKLKGRELLIPGADSTLPEPTDSLVQPQDDGQWSWPVPGISRHFVRNSISGRTGFVEYWGDLPELLLRDYCREVGGLQLADYTFGRSVLVFGGGSKPSVLASDADLGQLRGGAKFSSLEEFKSYLDSIGGNSAIGAQVSVDGEALLIASAGEPAFKVVIFQASPKVGKLQWLCTLSDNRLQTIPLIDSNCGDAQLFATGEYWVAFVHRSTASHLEHWSFQASPGKLPSRERFFVEGMAAIQSRLGDTATEGKITNALWVGRLRPPLRTGLTALPGRGVKAKASDLGPTSEMMSSQLPRAESTHACHRLRANWSPLDIASRPKSVWHSVRSDREGIYFLGGEIKRPKGNRKAAVLVGEFETMGVYLSSRMLIMSEGFRAPPVASSSRSSEQLERFAARRAATLQDESLLASLRGSAATFAVEVDWEKRSVHVLDWGHSPMLLLRLWTEPNDASIKVDLVSRADHMRKLHEQGDSLVVYVALHHQLLPHLQNHLMERVEMPQEERHLRDLAVLFQRWVERFCSERETQVALFAFNQTWQQE